MKHLFLNRLMASYVMIVAWGMDGPIIKTYYNLLPAQFFGIVGIWALIVGLSQKWLRKNFSIQTLLKMTITTDVLFIVIISYFNAAHNIKGMLIFESIINGPYMAILYSTSEKLNTYYLSGLKHAMQDSIKATIYNRKLISSMFGLAVGTILSIFLSIFAIIWIKVILIIIGIKLELEALK